MQLSQQEALYNQHDPALSKHKRKIVYARIQKLLVAIEARMDQIYALYDVLEGQKTSGQMMKEEEVEVTLQNLGIDLAAAHRFQNKDTTKAPPAVVMVTSMTALAMTTTMTVRNYHGRDSRLRKPRRWIGSDD